MTVALDKAAGRPRRARVRMDFVDLESGEVYATSSVLVAVQGGDNVNN